MPSELRAGESNAGGMVPQMAAAAGASGPAPNVTIDGIEVAQVVQDLNNSVLLIAEKPTLARVYVSAQTNISVTVRGTLSVRRVGDSVWTPVPSMGDVILDPNDADSAGLQRKRENLALSLNFLLPVGMLSLGNVEVQLSQLEQLTDSGSAAIAIPAGANLQLSFVKTAPLRLHLLGIRYQNQPGGGPLTTFEPAAIDYALIQSWLLRAYPIVQLDYSQLVIDWPASNAPWPSDDNALKTWGRDVVNPYLSALRAQDVSSGTDFRTHYFGLAADGGGFMRGWASTVPTTPDPSVVASGPAGKPLGSFDWDTDGSYADWYTGHELAHTLGRAHPGFCNGNSADDPAFPFPNGQLAHNDGDFVGYDNGDPNHAISSVALPGVDWHDLMTYCKKQWLSKYTYEGIYHRLVAEDALPNPSAGGTGGPSPSGQTNPAGGGNMPGHSGGIHVVARINQTKNAGQFRFVTPIEAAATSNAGLAAGVGEYEIRIKNAAGSTVSYYAPFRKDACGDSNQPDITGSLEIVLPVNADMTELELVHDNVILDTFTPGTEPPEPNDIRSANAGGGAVPLSMSLNSPSHRPKITWSAVSPPGGALPMAMANAAAANKPAKGPVFMVQVSTNQGSTWNTVGMGLTSPEVTLDPQIFANKDKIQIRVTASNGFKTKTTTQTLDVKSL